MLALIQEGVLLFSTDYRYNQTLGGIEHTREHGQFHRIVKLSHYLYRYRADYFSLTPMDYPPLHLRIYPYSSMEMNNYGYTTY